MALPVKNIAFVGSNGNLGSAFMDVFPKSGSEFCVTLLTRKESEAKTRALVAGKPQFSVRGVSYDDQDDLVAALAGQDAVLSTVGNDGIMNQLSLIAAAEKAGVRYFVPAEYASDTNHPENRDIVLFEQRHTVQRALREASLSYILVHTGFFSEYAISPFFGWDVANKKVSIVGDGSARNSFTSRHDIARFTIGVLKRTSEFRNREARFASLTLSLNEWVALAEQESGAKFDVEHIPVEPVKAAVAKDRQETGGWATVAEQLRLILACGSGRVDWGSNRLDNSRFPEIETTPALVFVKQALGQQ